MLCDKLALQGGFLNKTSHFDVIVTGDSMVNDQQPHPHIFKRFNRLARTIDIRELLNKIIEKFCSVPNSFRQVTSERFKRIVNVEKSCPQIFKIALKFRLLMLLEVIQVAL